MFGGKLQSSQGRGGLSPAKRAAAALTTTGLLMIGVVSTAGPVTGATAQAAKLTASDAATEDRLGRAIAMTDDTLLVAAWTDDHSPSIVDAGTVYVYELVNGVWIETQTLRASDAASGDQFGVEAAIDGDLAVVGSFRDDDDGTNSGSAYVYARTPSGWVEEAKLTASDGAPGDEFGHTVRISGETVLVGTWNDNDAGANSGSAYVYTRTGSGWVEEAKLTASDAAAGDQYAISVAISGDTAAVGSWKDDDDGIDSGSAYIYTRTGTSWSEQAKLTAPTGRARDRFGGRMAIDGDTVLVGAWRDDDKGTDSGSAHIFVRSGTAWSHQAQLNGTDTAARDAFGLAAALKGDRAVITAWRNDQQATNAGAAYVFDRTGTQWNQTHQLVADDGGPGDELGARVGFAGDIVVVGAWQNDERASNAGAAYVFDVSGSTPPPPPPPPPPGRTFPAGAGTETVNGVSLGQRGSTVTVTGTSGANEVYVTEVDGDIQIGVAGSNASWDGRSYRSAAVTSVRVNLGAGDDAFHIGDAANNPTEGPLSDTVRASLIVELGQNDDELATVDGTTVSGNLAVRALGGESTIALGDLVVTGTMSLTTRNGADRVDLGQARIARRAGLNLGGGTNQVDAEGADLSGGLSIRTTSGADQVTLIDTQVGSTTSVNLSSGDDRFEATNTTFARRATLNVGPGTNQVTATDTEFAQGFSVRGGNQVDSVDLAGVTIGRGLGSMSTGSGNDMVSLGLSGGAARVDTGAGNDDIHIAAETVAQARATVNAGSGNDDLTATIEVVGTEPQVGPGVSANGGSGTDSIDITGSGGQADPADLVAALRLAAIENISAN